MPKADCILVLGAGMKPNGEPSLMLRDRLNRAIELYRAGVSDRFLLTGDHGRKGYNEVQGMKDYIMANLDIPEDKIFMDHAGFSTYESIVPEIFLRYIIRLLSRKSITHIARCTLHVNWDWMLMPHRING